jgi:hypothetical protein
MKDVVIFLLFLCFQLLGRYDSAYFPTHNYKTGYSSTQDIKRTSQVESANEKKGYLITVDTSVTEENDYPIFVEDEDEEDAATKKSTFPAKCFSTFSYAFTLRPCDCRINLISFYNPPSYTSSCKYITHRAILI